MYTQPPTCVIKYSIDFHSAYTRNIYDSSKYVYRNIILCVILWNRYNPEHDTESRLLRHRAAALQDLANSFLDHDLSEEFEKVHYLNIIIDLYSNLLFHTEFWSGY